MLVTHTECVRVESSGHIYRHEQLTTVQTAFDLQALLLFMGEPRKGGKFHVTQSRDSQDCIINMPIAVSITECTFSTSHIPYSDAHTRKAHSQHSASPLRSAFFTSHTPIHPCSDTHASLPSLTIPQIVCNAQVLEG